MFRVTQSRPSENSQVGSVSLHAAARADRLVANYRRAGAAIAKVSADRNLSPAGQHAKAIELLAPLRAELAALQADPAPHRARHAGLREWRVAARPKPPESAGAAMFQMRETDALLRLKDDALAIALLDTDLRAARLVATLGDVERSQVQIRLANLVDLAELDAKIVAVDRPTAAREMELAEQTLDTAAQNAAVVAAKIDGFVFDRGAALDEANFQRGTAAERVFIAALAAWARSDHDVEAAAQQSAIEAAAIAAAATDQRERVGATPTAQPLPEATFA